MLFVQRAAGADDGPDFLDAVMRHHVLRAVVQKQHHGIALDYAQGLQARGKGIAGGVEFGPADALAIPMQGGLGAARARVATQMLMQGLLRCIHAQCLQHVIFEGFP